MVWPYRGELSGGRVVHHGDLNKEKNITPFLPITIEHLAYLSQVIEIYIL